MTTLRREIRKKILEILESNIRYWEGRGNAETLGDIADQIADAVIEEKKSKVDLAKADPAWRILFGEESDIDSAVAEKEALDAFERDMQVPDNWSWYPARTSDEKAWKYLRDFVVATHKKDPKAFEKYQTWRTQPYARGAMSNLAIKRNPENFPASWSDFLSSTGVTGLKNKQMTLPTTDDNDVPITY